MDSFADKGGVLGLVADHLERRAAELRSLKYVGCLSPAAYRARGNFSRSAHQYDQWAFAL